MHKEQITVTSEFMADNPTDTLLKIAREKIDFRQWYITTRREDFYCDTYTYHFNEERETSFKAVFANNLTPKEISNFITKIEKLNNHLTLFVDVKNTSNGYIEFFII